MKSKHVVDEEFNYWEDRELLTEANLNRIVNGHDKDGYVIISAHRQDALADSNPDANENELWQENNKRNKKLNSDINSLGYAYIPVYGGYKEEGQDVAQVEKSFIVFPYQRRNNEQVDYETFLSNMMQLGKKYNQDSILVKYPNDDPQYFNLLTNSWEGKKFKNATLNDAQQIYFTALKGWNDINLNKKNRTSWQGKPQRFTYSESYLNKSPQSVMSASMRASEGEMFYFKPIRRN